MTLEHERDEWFYLNQGYLKLPKVVHSASNPKKDLGFIIGGASLKVKESEKDDKSKTFPALSILQTVKVPEAESGVF